MRFSMAMRWAPAIVLCIAAFTSDAARLHARLPSRTHAVAVDAFKRLRLFEVAFPTPNANAPHALHQASILPPHSHDAIVASTKEISQHVVKAVAATWPEPDVWNAEEPSLVQAIQWSASALAHSPSRLIQARDSALRAFETAVKLCRSYNNVCAQLVPAHATSLTSKHNFCAVQAIVDALVYPDVDLAYKLCTGFELSGIVEKSNVHRPCPPGSLRKKSRRTVSPRQWNSKMVGSMRKRALRLDAQGCQDALDCYDATLKEVADAWAIGSERGDHGMDLEELHRRFGEDACALRRFPHRRFPGAPVRPVDDASENGLNDDAIMSETIACENADFPCRAARMFWALLGPVPMHVGTDDLTKAYRQFATSQPHVTVVGVWNPRRKRTEFFVLRGMPFGAAASVNQFNRCPKLVVAICRCFFGISLCHYYDDYAICEPAPVCAHAQFVLRRVHELLGWRLDVAKHARAAFANPFLGVITDFAVAHLSGHAVMLIKPERREKLTAALRQIVATKKLTPAQAASMRGKLYFTCCSVYGRVGRAALRAFTNHQYGKSRLADAALISACAFFLCLFKRNMPRAVRLQKCVRSQLVIWSDAALERGIGRLGFVAYDPDDSCFFTSHYDVPSELINCFVHPEHCIGQLEIFAAMFVYLSLPNERLRNRRVFHYVDNTSAISALFKGYSGKSDSSRLVNIFACLQAVLRFDVWWEYVPSAANIADMPSRLDYSYLHQLCAVWVQPFVLTVDAYMAPISSWLP